MGDRLRAQVKVHPQDYGFMVQARCWFSRVVGTEQVEVHRAFHLEKAGNQKIDCTETSRRSIALTNSGV